MIKHIIKIIWAQRRSNGWIVGELLLVVCAVWFMLDKLWVDMRCYRAPMGYDIENTWRFRLSRLSKQAPGFVSDSLRETSDTQDLLALMDRIRLLEEVEGVCVSFWSMPYSFGNSWGGLFPVDGDTTGLSAWSYHKLRVSPEYFEVFRIKDTRGRDVTPLVSESPRPTVLTRAGEEHFFGGQSAVGRQISENDDLSAPFTVVAVLPTFRSNDFDRPENCFFSLLKGEALEECVRQFGVENAEVSVRMRREMTEDEMFRFLENASERLTVNNFFVQGVTLLADQRERILAHKIQANDQKLAVMLFLLVNVFFGIVGTFWLRTERRRGEIGLRMAIGSSRAKLGRYILMEGLGLLAVTLPVLLLFALNMAYLDKLDTYREPLTLLRFAATSGLAYLLLGGMIGLGVWLPSRKAARMAPAEALRYE